jgi:hypothetical protein
MDTTLKSYIDKLVEIIYKKINKYFSENKDDHKLIQEHFTFLIDDPFDKRKHFKHFQEYYFQTLENQDKLFFKEFRKHYSLLGVDMKYINKLEKSKSEILKLIQEGKLSKLYYDFFATDDKHFGSFFTKIIHTFNPKNYCPIDNQIKNYFKLERESYFVTLLVVSEAFKIWSSKNRQRMDSLKTILINYIKDNMKDIKSKNLNNKITDMKLLNIIIWSVANSSQI